MSTPLPRYVVITPARNEAAFIEKTIQSMIHQTVLPERWVIVSDGSTDGTDELVAGYSAVHPWIALVRTPERRDRNFAGKVGAFNLGLATLAHVDYEAIASLDGDISFDEDYFEFVLQKLVDDPRLGLIGAPYRDSVNAPHDYRFASIEHATGPCQLFRRACFEQIGGYTAVKGGGIDRIADIAVRMHGWKTRTFPERLCLHYRPTGTAQHGVLKAKFRDGHKVYCVGSSPVWEAFRAVYQMVKKPYVIGSLMEASGYFWALARRVERPVPPEMVEFCRREQMQRLRRLLTTGAGVGMQRVSEPARRPQGSA